VALLTGLGPVVAFSAAIPGQGGTGHLNEQWPGYWSARFARSGYRAFDVIRPQIWMDDRIAWWFRQNIVLYVAQGADVLAPPPQPAVDEVLPLVHPALFNHLVSTAAPPAEEPAPPTLPQRLRSRVRLRTRLRALRRRLR